MYVEYVDKLVGPTEDKPDKKSQDSNHTSAEGSLEGFQVTQDGKLKIIKFNKPEKKNAISTAMYKTFSQVQFKTNSS